MDDTAILDLYGARSERAIAETEKQYGRYCRTVAFRILRSTEDSEECVNDTYLRAWNAIPPQRPARFSVFLGKITRNLSLDRVRCRQARKRGPVPAALDELMDCVPAPGGDFADDLLLAELLNAFLKTLSVEARRIFLRRYWYFCSIREIAENGGISESKVKMTLLRTRNQLKAMLEKEGVSL